ncbi:MAG: ABC transporter ATP-binding protein [Candidatus Eiseniibacteriota bacterium]|jgi:ATP-binding cassette subfamily B protein
MAHGRPAGIPAPHSQTGGTLYDARLVRRLWTYIRPQQGLIWLSLGLLLLTSGCSLALPYIVKIAIDRHLTAGRLEGFWGLVGLFAAIALIELTGKSLQTWTVDLAGQNALLGLRLDLFRHLQRLRPSFYDRTPIGRLIGRVTTDIEALQEMFSTGVVTILGDLVFLSATVAILLSMSWRLTLVTMLVVPVLLVVTLAVRIRVRSAYTRMVAARSRLNAYLHEQVQGMPVVQMFVRELLARRGFSTINRAMRDAQLGSVRWESFLSASTEMLGSFTLALILWYGGRLILGSSPDGTAARGLTAGMTLGSLFAFIDYMQRFFGPLNDLSLKYTVMQNAMTASDRIFRLLDVDERIAEPAHPVTAPPTRGAIRFDRVTFGYGDDEPVLRDLSFEVAPGERVALVGATGAGKTTILKLLTRLYDVREGTITLDGIDLRDYPLRDLRRRVGIVPQDVFLFGGDILGNIRLGHPETPDAAAIAAADRLHLDEVVRRFPGGYHEPVRERGGNLSSGERQLIAFARVLVEAPPVLVLDEATSSVDSHTEHLLQEAVHMLMQGRSSLIIAHRLSTVRDVDRILVMHRGRLVEEGTHEALLERRGTYWRLYQLQYQEQDRNGEIDVAS